MSRLGGRRGCHVVPESKDVVRTRLEGKLREQTRDGGEKGQTEDCWTLATQVRRGTHRTQSGISSIDVT